MGGEEEAGVADCESGASADHSGRVGVFPRGVAGEGFTRFAAGEVGLVGEGGLAGEGGFVEAGEGGLDAAGEGGLESAGEAGGEAAAAPLGLERKSRREGTASKSCSRYNQPGRMHISNQLEVGWHSAALSSTHSLAAWRHPPWAWARAAASCRSL